MSRKNRLARTAAALLLCVPLLALAACSEDAQPDKVEWEVVSATDIVAIDDSSDVYISGSMFNVNSETIIDYKYARELSSGGVRQAMISDLWADNAEWDYPGAEAVTIYQDIDKDSTDKARIEVLKCDPPAPEEKDSIFKEGSVFGPAVKCVMPDGTSMGSTKHRIDIHVPKGSVVNADSLAPKETTP